jgi:hypothetical protein
VGDRVWQLRIDASFGRFLLDAQDSRELGRGLLDEVAARACELGLRGIADFALAALTTREEPERTCVGLSSSRSMSSSCTAIEPPR